jgi:hypothetical protein
MSQDEDVARLKQRIAHAESDQDTWRASRNQEKYLESFFRADALERDLDQLRKLKRANTAKAAEPWPVEAPPPARRARSAPIDAGERERLMQEYSIAPSGRQYQYSHYRYDRFEDALGYAMKQRLAPSACDAADSLPPARIEEAPDDEERRRMAGLGITFDQGVYHLGPYRYDRLADALDYAGSADAALGR